MKRNKVKRKEVLNPKTTTKITYQRVTARKGGKNS